MKKTTTILASAMAMIGAAVTSATVATESFQTTAQSQQVAQQSGSNVPTQQQQPVSANEIKTAAVRSSDDFGKSLKGMSTYRPSGYTKWCNAGSSGGFNRIKHGRSVRRKNRRA